MYVLCFERRPARATVAASGAVPALTAAMIFFCAGQIRIQTFIAMMVPNIAPTWMNTARGAKTRDIPQAATATSANETSAPGCSLPAIAFQTASYTKKTRRIRAIDRLQEAPLLIVESGGSRFGVM